MKAVVQRVKSASVAVSGEKIAEIKEGLLVLLGVEKGDGDADAVYLAAKISNMRIFSDENGKFSFSVKDTGGDILAVSQFTLLADTKKGNRPSFTLAEAPETANALYMSFCENAEAEIGKSVMRGIFGADMLVSIENDGPVTIIIDSRQKFKTERDSR